MEYLDETNIAVCKTATEQDMAFKEAAAEERPCLFIRKRRKYAYVRCDMHTTEYDLTEEALAEIREMQDHLTSLAWDNPNNNEAPVGRCIGPTFISMDDLLIPNARSFIKAVEEIATNPENQEFHTGFLFEMGDDGEIQVDTTPLEEARDG